MNINCLNKNNPVIKGNLNELSAVVGDITAEWLLILNNGNSLDYNPDGSVNEHFKELLHRFDGDRTAALRERADELSSYTDEMRQIYEEAVKNGTFMKAPNGKPTNLNERQWLQVRTKAFKDWFGDWINDPANASKVVDENGEPLVVYHGGQANIDVFNPRTEELPVDVIRTNLHRKNRVGVYFSKDIQIGENYTRLYKENGKIYNVFLNIKNPLNVKFSTTVKNRLIRFITLGKIRKLDAGDVYTDDLNNLLAGYDGINHSNGMEYVVFDSNQIKSATDNNGEFSVKNNNIYLQQIKSTSVPTNPHLKNIGKYWDNKPGSKKHAKNIMQVGTVLNSLMKAFPSDVIVKGYLENVRVPINRFFSNRTYIDKNGNEVKRVILQRASTPFRQNKLYESERYYNVQAVKELCIDRFNKAKALGYIDRYKILDFDRINRYDEEPIYEVTFRDMTDYEIQQFEYEEAQIAIANAEAQTWKDVISSDKNLLDKFNNNKSIKLSALLDNIIKYSDRKPFQKFVSIISDVIGELGNIDVELVTPYEMEQIQKNYSAFPRTAAGLYEPSTNKIYICNQVDFHYCSKDGVVDNTLLHEVVHAIVFNSRKNEKQITKLRNIYDRAIELVEKQTGKTIEWLTSNENPNSGAYYGFTNLDEFVSELFTNSRFLQVLNSLGERVDGTQTNIFKRIVNWIWSLIKPNSKLAIEATNIVDDILLNFEGRVLDNRYSMDSISRPMEQTTPESIITIERNANEKEFEKINPKLYQYCKSTEDLYNYPGITPSKIRGIASTFVEILIDTLDSVFDGNTDTYEYLTSSYPNIFTEDNIIKLNEIRKENNASVIYREFLKTLGVKNIFNIVLAEIHNSMLESFPEVQSLYEEVDGQYKFRTAYIDLINPMIHDYFGFTITPQLTVSKKEEFNSDEAETEKEFDFLTSNLEKSFYDTIDLKVKNLLTRIPKENQYDEYGNQIYYPRQHIMNKVGQLCVSSSTFEEMVDAISNMDDIKYPYKNQLLDIFNDPRYRQALYRSFEKAKQYYINITNTKKTELRREFPSEKVNIDDVSSQILEIAVPKNSSEAKKSLFYYTDENDIKGTIEQNKEIKNKISSLITELGQTKIKLTTSRGFFRLPESKEFKQNVDKNKDEIVSNITNTFDIVLNNIGFWRFDEDKLRSIVIKENGEIDFSRVVDTLNGLLKFLSKNNPMSAEALTQLKNLNTVLTGDEEELSESVVYVQDKSRGKNAIGKSYSTLTTTNHLKQLEKKIKKATKSNEKYQEFVDNEFNKYRFFGRWYNFPWYKSWIKDGLHDFKVYTLTSVNGIPYNKMIRDDQHFEYAFINFINSNNGIANYVLPVLSDKNNNGTISGQLFDTNEVVDRLFSVFMQELDRIKEVYNRAQVRRAGGQGVASIKNWDTGELTIDGKLDFSSPKIGGGEFKLLGMLNPILARINDKIEDENSLEYLMQSYIYNSDELAIKDLLSNTNFINDMQHAFSTTMDAILYFMSQDFADDFIKKDGKYYKFYNRRFKKAVSTFNKLNEKFAVDNNEELLTLFFYNNFYAKTQIFELLVGDLALYDNWNDTQKRMAAVISPTLKYDVGATMPNSNTKYSDDGVKRAIVISDVEGKSSQYDIISKIFNKRTDKAKTDAAKANIQAELKLFTETNGTDGQGFLSLTGLRKHLGMLGYAPAYLDTVIDEMRGILKENNVNTQKERWEKLKKEYPQAVFEIVKQFTYGPLSYDDVTNDNSKIKLGTMVKNAEVPMVDFDEMLNSNPLLLALLKFMEDNNIDVLYTKSNIKSGNKKVVDLNECTTVEDVTKALTTAVTNDNRNDYLLEIPFEATGEQNPVAKHYRDKTINFGTQVMKLMPSMIMRCFSGKKINFNGKEFEADKFLNLYEHLLSAMHRDSLNKITRSLGIDKEIRDKLQKGIELTDKEALRLRIGFCDYVREQLKKDPHIDPRDLDQFTLTASGDWKVPKNDQIFLKRLDKVCVKLIKDSCINLDVKGGYLVQSTDSMRLNALGAEGNTGLRIMFYDADGSITAKPKNPMGVAYLEARIPRYTNAFKNLSEDEIPDNLRKLIAYRTPTEGACSIFPIKVVGFSPDMGGGKIQLPMDITSIAGVDFDFDKLFFHAPHSNKNGKIEYDVNEAVRNMTRAQMENMLLDIMWEVCTSEEYMYEMFTPSNFIALKRYADIFKVFKAQPKEKQTIEEFKRLEALDNDSLKAESSRIDNNSYLCDFKTEMYIHQRNAMSAQEIGPLAINNVIHSLLEGRGVKMMNVFSGCDFCGVSLGESTVTDPVEDVLGSLVYVNCKALLAAAVDGAKSPVLGELNLTMDSINIVTTLLRLGVPLKSGILFLQQPIVQMLLDRYADKLDEYSYEDNPIKKRPELSEVFAELKNELIGNYTKMYNSEPAISTGNNPITDQLLVEGITVDLESNSREALDNQMPLLTILGEIIDCNGMFRKQIKILRADTKTGVADLRSVFDFMAFLTNADKTTGGRILHEYSIMPGNKAKQFSKEFYDIFDTESKNSIYNIADQFQQMSSTLDLFWSTFTPVLKDFYKKVVTYINSLTDIEFSSNDIRQMYAEYMVFQMLNNDSEFLDNSLDAMEYYANHVQGDIVVLQKKLARSPEYKNNFVVKNVYFNRKKKTIGISTRSIQNDVVQKISEDWLRLLYSDNADAAALGKKLLTYMFYKDGGSSEKGSMGRFVTVDMMNAIVGYPEFLENMLVTGNEFDGFSGATSLDNFVDLYFRHHPDKAMSVDNKNYTVELMGESLKDKDGKEIKAGDNPVYTKIKVANNTKDPLPDYFQYNGVLYKNYKGGEYHAINQFGGTILEYSINNLLYGSVINSNNLMKDESAVEVSDEAESTGEEILEKEEIVADVAKPTEEKKKSIFTVEITDPMKRESTENLKGVCK